MEAFCAAVLALGGQLESIALRENSIDIGWFGSPEPRRAFIHSSSDEAGSLIQMQWLQEGVRDIPPDGAIAIVHGLQDARRYQLYLSSRLISADHLVVIDVRTGRGGSGDDRLIIEQDNPYSRMLPLARVEYAVQEFGAPGWFFKDRWKAQVLESGKEVIEDQIERLFSRP